MNKKKYFKIISVNFLVFLSLILILEIITGDLIYGGEKKICNYLLCNKTFKYETNLHSNLSNYKIVYSRDSYGFRDRKKKLDKIDILAVGGSTTDQRYLNNEDTWTNLLEKKLELFFKKNIDVVNSGIDGQSSNGHVWNFKNWYSKLENFSPKYILFYIGLNEQLYLNPNDYTNRSFDFKLNFSELNYLDKTKYIIKINNGFIIKIKNLLEGFFYKKIDINNLTHSQNRKEKKFLAPTKIFKIHSETKKIFLNNLNLLNDESLKLNSIPIFITQKSLRGKKINEKVYSISEYDYYNFEKEISEIIIIFCKNKNIYCIDLNSNFYFNAKDTYDLVHLSPNGSKKLSEAIFQNLKNTIKF